MRLEFLTQVLKVDRFLGQKLKHVLAEGSRTLIKECVHEVNQLLLGFLVHVVFSHLNHFVRVESSDKLLSHGIGAVLISVDSNLAGSALLVAVQNDLLLLA